MRLVNNYSRPITLEDGTILAAADTEGSSKEVKNLDEKDYRRYVATGRISIIEPVKKEKKEDSK